VVSPIKFFFGGSDVSV